MKRVGTEPFCAHDSLVLISGWSALDQFIPFSIELCVPVSLKKWYFNNVKNSGWLKLRWRVFRYSIFHTPSASNFIETWSALSIFYLQFSYLDSTLVKYMYNEKKNLNTNVSMVVLNKNNSTDMFRISLLFEWIENPSLS